MRRRGGLLADRDFDPPVFPTDTGLLFFEQDGDGSGISFRVCLLARNRQLFQHFYHDVRLSRVGVLAVVVDALKRTHAQPEHMQHIYCRVESRTDQRELVEDYVAWTVRGFPGVRMEPTKKLK